MLEPYLLGHVVGMDRLIPLHSKWIYNVWHAESKVTVFQAHRNSYKTTSIVQVGMLWWLLLNPNATILFVRKTINEAVKQVKVICEWLQTPTIIDLYTSMYPQTQPPKEYKPYNFQVPWRDFISAEASITPKGILSRFTGSHHSHILCDDVVDLADRKSHVERANTIGTVRELRRVVTVDGKLMVVGTPWHPQDLYSILPEPIKYPLGTVPLPEFTDEWIDNERSRSDPAEWSANYLLEHSANKNALLRDIPIKKGAFDFEDLTHGVGYIDTAFKGNCTTAVTWVKYDHGVYYIYGKTYTKPFPDAVDAICLSHEATNCGTLYVESNADQGATVRHRFSQYPFLQDHRATKNKHLRILEHVYRNRKDIVLDDRSDPDYVNQILSYEETRTPCDAPDSLAGAILLVRTAQVKSLVRIEGGFNELLHNEDQFNRAYAST